MGSTSGLPDCWLPVEHCGQVLTCHLELKCGELIGDWLVFKVRPEQRRELKAMVRDGVKVGFLVGIKGSGSCCLLAVGGQSLAGKVEFGEAARFVLDPALRVDWGRKVYSFFFPRA